jgi:hypothetical protein
MNFTSQEGVKLTEMRGKYFNIREIILKEQILVWKNILDSQVVDLQPGQLSFSV